MVGASALLGQWPVRHLFGAEAPVSPQNLLTRTFPPGVLAKSLQSEKDFHPYPTAAERAPWQALPMDLRRALVLRAEALPAGPLPTLPASSFLSYHVNGNRSVYEGEVFARSKQLTTLVLAECVEGKGRFLPRIGDIVWAICEETFWGLPAHIGRQRDGEGLPDVTDTVIDLFAAEAAMNLAWTRYLVGPGLDALSPEFNKRIVYEIDRRILTPGLTRDDQWWMSLGPRAQRANNWNPWICSNWMAALLLTEARPDKRIAGVQKIMRVIDIYLNQYPADGGDEEGPGYWSRSPASYFDCVRLLVAATGGASHVLADPFVRSMGEYMLHAHIAGPAYTNYGDAYLHPGPSGPLLYQFGKATGSASLQAFGAFITNAGNANDPLRSLPGAQDLGRELTAVLDLAEIHDAKQSDALPRDAWYPVLGLMAARQLEGSTAGFYLAAEAAATGRSHGHCDSGSFIVFHDGDPVFIDLGSQTYTKATFGKDRTKLMNIQSQFHNLPTINGIQQGYSERFRASALRYRNTEDAAQMSCDLATAYPKEAGIRQWIRTVRLDRKLERITIEEDFTLNGEAPLKLSLMTSRVPALEAPGTIALSSLAAGKKIVKLTFDATALNAEIEKIDLTDDGLKHQWGSTIYRILLSPKAPVASGDWTLQVHA